MCRRLVLVLVFAILSPSLVAQDEVRPPSAEKVYSMLVNALSGSQSITEESISEQGLFVDGVKQSSLRSALIGPNKSNTIVGEAARKVLSYRTYLSGDKMSAHILAMTGNKDRSQPRYHSVLFVKSSEGVWQIWSWHISHE